MNNKKVVFCKQYRNEEDNERIIVYQVEGTNEYLYCRAVDKDYEYDGEVVTESFVYVSFPIIKNGEFYEGDILYSAVGHRSFKKALLRLGYEL